MDYIKVAQKGSYYIGGKKVTISGGSPFQTRLLENGPLLEYSPDGDYQAGQMYVQYTRLADPILPYPVCMIHGGGMTGSAFESTLTGEPGWEFMFLKAGFHVNLSDGVERGRSSWAKYPEINDCPPFFRNYSECWQTFRLGEQVGNLYEGCRFDANQFDLLVKQQVPRWTTSGKMVQEGYDTYLSDMTDGCILLAHSQGGLFALRAALKYAKNVKAVILIESSSTMDVKETDISAFKDIPFLFVWGDFLGGKYVHSDYRWIADFAYQDTMANLHQEILNMGGDSTWLHLPEIGILGNSHAMMIEDNSQQIADLVCDWIKEKVR